MEPVHPRAGHLVVVAADGYGKTALLEELRPPSGVVRSAVSLLADGDVDGSWVGVDDLHEVPRDRARDLVARLCVRPGRRLALASCQPLHPGVRSALTGPVFERGPEDLALRPFAVATRLADEHGVTDPETAVAVHELTAGWPALVRFAGDALARDPQADLVATWCAPGSPASEWLRDTVLDRLPRASAQMLEAFSGLGPLTQELCERLAHAMGTDAAEVAGVVATWQGIGLLVPRRKAGGVEHHVVPALTHVLATSRARSATRSGTKWHHSTVELAAAETYEAAGAWLPAARALAWAGRDARAARLLEEHGDDMLRDGEAAEVAALVSVLTSRQSEAGSATRCVGTRVARIRAEALRRAGDLAGSRRAYGALLADVDGDGLDTGLAASAAQLHYTTGEFEAALALLDRCRDAERAGPLADTADWLACRVHTLAALGRVDEAAPVADRLLELAESSGESLALGVAHLAAARLHHGSRKEAHHVEALRAATAAGDAPTVARTLAAQTHLLLAAARYDEACVSARESARMSQLCSPPGLRSAALHNLAEALFRVGQHDEGLWQLRRSIALSRRLGPVRAALGLVGLADMHRQLGHRQRSRAAYEEALELAHGSGDTQVLVAAMSGLARLDPDAAEAVGLAEDAERLATDALRPAALVAQGWVALASGNRATAAGHAARAVDAARGAHALDLLADSLELLAEASDDAGEQRAALVEALSIWEGGGARTAAARVLVLLARLPGAGPEARSRGREAAHTLQRQGISLVHDRLVTDSPATATVVIQVLGPFRVSVDGREVPLPAWRSRQARTLVKVLAGARGSVVTRDRLCEALWPDDDPARTGHRLSVLLATVRGVLDPAKAWPPDRHITADQHGIRLDLTHVDVDAEALLHDAAHAAELMDRGEDERALEILAHVDDRYRGEAFEGEFVERAQEWFDALREETRSAWVRSVRRLATLHGRNGRTGESLALSRAAARRRPL